MILILFAFSSLFLNAQEPVVLIAPNIELDAGQEFVDIDIRVASFTGVMGMQFTLNWDPEVLDFIYVDSVNFGLDFIHHEDNFGITNAENGVLTFFWLDETFQGVDLIDNSVIFSFKTRVVGSPAQSTVIEFGNVPTAIEISDVNEMVLPFETESGNVTVGGVSSVNNQERPEGFSIAPNPFKEIASVDFALNTKSNVLLQVYDQEGKIIIEKVKSYGSGLHTIQIHNNELSTAGVYYLNLTTEEFQVSEKLVFIK